jgi:hypothetical protein
VGFETSQQTLLVMDDIYSGMTMGFSRSFLSSPYMYAIFGSFFVVDCCQIFFYISFVVIACNLDQIIKLLDLIGCNQVNGLSNVFFILFLKTLSSLEHSILTLKKLDVARVTNLVNKLLLYVTIIVPYRENLKCLIRIAVEIIFECI